jgi:hypothetical protein
MWDVWEDLDVEGFAVFGECFFEHVYIGFCDASVFASVVAEEGTSYVLHYVDW